LSATAPAATAQVYPSVRAEPTPSVREPGPVERTFGPPETPGRPETERDDRDRDIPDRAILRGEAGDATGTADVPRTGRPVARSSAGEAIGTVDPARSGGGVVRGPDGSAQGLVPSGPPSRGGGAARR
jgi:hypothetical protein